MKIDDWAGCAAFAVTVCDETGTVIYMNGKSRETFASSGGAALLGTSVFDCHPPRALAKVRELYEMKVPNAYFILKDGRRKLIFQSPLFEDGMFRGFVELALPVPADIPEFHR